VLLSEDEIEKAGLKLVSINLPGGMESNR